MGNTSSMLTQNDIEEIQQHWQPHLLLGTVNGLNFKEFVGFLSIFGPRAGLQQKIEFIFRIHDVECHGKVTFDNTLDVMRDLTGQYISEQQWRQVLTLVLEDAGYAKDSSLVLSDFMKILGNSGLKMEVEIPAD